MCPTLKICALIISWTFVFWKINKAKFLIFSEFSHLSSIFPFFPYFFLTLRALHAPAPTHLTRAPTRLKFVIFFDLLLVADDWFLACFYDFLLPSWPISSSEHNGTPFGLKILPTYPQFGCLNLGFGEMWFFGQAS